MSCQPDRDHENLAKTFEDLADRPGAGTFEDLADRPWAETFEDLCREAEAFEDLCREAEAFEDLCREAETLEGLAETAKDHRDLSDGRPAPWEFGRWPNPITINAQTEISEANPSSRIR